MKQLVYLLALLALVSSIQLELNDRAQQCFGVLAGETDELKIQYVVSGSKDAEKNLQMDIWDNYDFKGKPIYTMKYKNELKHKLNPTKLTPYKICFQSLDNSKKVLSFNFSKKPADLQLASSDTIKESRTDLDEIYKQLESVFRQQQYQSIRESTHMDILYNTETRVRWCSMSKLITIIVICGIQILVLKGFFKSTPNTSFGV